MKILFIFPYPWGVAPSQRFRFEQYIPMLLERGIECDFHPFWSRSGWEVLYAEGKYVKKLFELKLGFLRRWLLMFRLYRYDLVFVHREAAPLGPPVFEWIASRLWRKPLIYDFDDAIWLPNTSEVNRMAAWLKNHGKVRNICRWASRISTGNAWLAAWAADYNSAVTINPTTIDLNYHDHRIRKGLQAGRRPVIGWTGTHSTARYLHLLIPVFRKLAQQLDFEFLVISNQAPPLSLPQLVFEPWDGRREIEQLSRIDIGVMPLEEHEWEKGKCGFKILQYMALGIPALASPVGVNSEIIEQGVNGYLCAGVGEWEEALRRLLLDEALCRRLGEAGRTTVERRYSVDANMENFLGLFN